MMVLFQTSRNAHLQSAKYSRTDSKKAFDFRFVVSYYVSVDPMELR